MRKIQVLHTTDDKGKIIVKVPLSNSDQYATLYEQDFSQLVELGLTLHWKQGTDGLINVSVPGRTRVAVARLITDASTQRVGYLNGDKTDLRRDNLIVDGNGVRAKLRARDLVVPTPRLNRIEVEHVYKQSDQYRTVSGVVS